MMAATETEYQPFWKTQQTHNSIDKWVKFTEKDWNIGIQNLPKLGGEIYNQHMISKANGWWRDGMWYRYFDNKPQLRVPATFHPDYLDCHGYEFVSPKLFTLLDQPRGTVQGLTTDTTWLWSSPPDWSYLWLSFIPIVPAIDTDLVHPDNLEIDRWGTANSAGIAIKSHDFLPLRDDIGSPFGVFRAAESPTLILASDTVAVSVLRAGYTGIDFRELETSFVRDCPTRRRSVNGIEELSDIDHHWHGIPPGGALREAARRARAAAMEAHKDPAATAHLRRGETLEKRPLE